MLKENIPVLRIFDVDKAREFYVDWLGFTIEWQHQFEPGTPLYMGIKKDDIQIHLSEHYGDATPVVKYLLPATKLKSITRNCKAGLTNIIAPAWKKHFITVCA